ncbi:MAG: hypothetical protein ACFNM8_06625 [Prevotella histicola]|uniref:hypothetical protein n=1 Tax=Prevotella histicola TaxID=470565 RepID=UPI0036231C4B
MSKSFISTSEQRPEHIHVKEFTDTQSILNMDVKQLPAVHEISYRYFSKVYRGIGIINQNKGIEFVSHELTTKPITLKNAGISFLPARKEQKSSRLCAFHDVTDYLAYLSLQDNGFIRLPSDCDVIIMSDVRNFWKSHTNLTHPGKYFRPSKVKIMRPTSPSQKTSHTPPGRQSNTDSQKCNTP